MERPTFYDTDVEYVRHAAKITHEAGNAGAGLWWDSLGDRLEQAVAVQERERAISANSGSKSRT